MRLTVCIGYSSFNQEKENIETYIKKNLEHVISIVKGKNEKQTMLLMNSGIEFI